MKTAFDFAKYFMKRGWNDYSFDGNMTIQKLLTFAFLIHLKRTGKTLFPEPILAFENGCVVEQVRLRYKNDYSLLLKESDIFQPDFTEDEYKTLQITLDLFGQLSARELSSINHLFDFWKNAFASSESIGMYRDKNRALVSVEDMRAELPKIEHMLKAYDQTQAIACKQEFVNDIMFNIDPALEITDELLHKLERFSRNADESAYYVGKDDDEPVIY